MWGVGSEVGCGKRRMDLAGVGYHGHEGFVLIVLQIHSCDVGRSITEFLQD